MFRVRYADAGDREAWLRMDRHLPEELFEGKVRDRMGYLLTDGGVPVGLLRYSLFWDSIPFCCLLFVEEARRGQGGGRALMDHWEGEMRQKGHRLLLTSTRSDEEAQHFYRRLGYQDAGGLLLTAPGYQQPLELFLAKTIDG